MSKYQDQFTLEEAMREIRSLRFQVDRTVAERDALKSLLWMWRWMGYSTARDKETEAALADFKPDFSDAARKDEQP